MQLIRKKATMLLIFTHQRWCRTAINRQQYAPA